MEEVGAFNSILDRFKEKNKMQDRDIMKDRIKTVSRHSVMIKVWDLNGFVILNDDFIKLYKKKVKQYGVGKLHREFDIAYGTVVDIYRKKDKLMPIDLLGKLCEKLSIDKSYAEKSVKRFAERNLKTQYKLKFPIEFTPLHLRIVSLIIGDGTGTPNRVYQWSQHKKNLNWGKKLIGNSIKIETHTRPVSLDEKCGILLVPRFLVEFTLKLFKCDSIKSFDFLQKMCKLPKKWKFQVFAQLVIDEESPDESFHIYVSEEEIKQT